MFRYYCLWALLFVFQYASSQKPLFQWAKNFTPHNTENLSPHSGGGPVAVDAQGNVYSAGQFQNTVDFDPGPGVYTLTGGAAEGFGIFISKLDASGNFVWAKQFPAYVEFGMIEIRVDKAGNVYLTSDLNQPTDMDPGPGVQMMTPTGFRDAFVVKLDTDGNLVWAKQFGGPGDTGPQGYTLEITPDNNLVVCGLFNNTVDFDPGPGTFNLISSAHMQSFVAKLTSNGEFVWAKQFGNSPVASGGSSIFDVRCDGDGNIYLAGDFSGTCDFDPGSAIYNLSCATYGDGFIAKLDAAGQFVWAKSIAGDPNTHDGLLRITGLDVDGMKNAIVTGTFVKTFDFDPGPGVTSISSIWPYDLFILKLNANGDFVWVKVVGDDGTEAGNDVVVDKANNIYVTGYVEKSADLDPGPGKFTVQFPQYGGAVLIKLKPDGNFVYGLDYQPITYGSAFFGRVVVDDLEDIYIGGFMGGTVDFDPGPNEFALVGSSSSPFVTKLAKCATPTSSVLDVSACSSYSLNNQTFDSSGTYIQTLPNATGCDSVITLHLTINKKVTQQAKTICEGESFYAGGVNQTASGIYTDTLHTTQGCDSVVITTLRVNPKPRPDLGPDGTLCAGSSVTITPGVFSGYEWQDQSTQSSFTLNTAGQYWAKVVDGNNCSASDTLTITAILPNPSDFLKQTDSLCSYGTVLLQPSGSYQNYLWSNGATSKTVEVSTPGVYWLQVSDANGCTGKDTTTIIAKQCLQGLFIPNAFTPNGDGKNDAFRVSAFGPVTKFKLQVFDRWGQLIFQTEDVKKGWDGRLNGVRLQSDVFAWICTYQLQGATQSVEKGTVTLIR